MCFTQPAISNWVHQTIFLVVIVIMTLSYTVSMPFVTVASIRHKDGLGPGPIHCLLALYTAIAANVSTESLDVNIIESFMA